MARWEKSVYKRACELRASGMQNKAVAKQLNAEFNLSLSTNAVKRKFVNEGYAQNQKGRVDIRPDGQTSTIKLRMTIEQSKNPDYVMQAHGYDPDEWELVQATNNIWEQNNQEQGLIQLYQSKIVVKPKTSAFKISTFTDKIEPIKIKQTNFGKRNLVIPLADWHFGITTLADVKDKLSRLIEIIGKGYKTITVLQLGDLFHSNQIKKSMTMAGTQLDDVDMVQAIKDGRAFFDVLLTTCLQNAENVTIEHAEGNHDGGIEYMFLVYLEAKYPDVKVNYHNKYRQAFLLDNVGIMVTHGQYGKRKDLPMLFATEFTDVWARAKSREIYTGHFHTQQTLDYSGVIHRQLGTIKPNDSYEIENGWTMGKKTLQVFEYDSDRLRVTYDV